jgi:hypothetical protein
MAQYAIRVARSTINLGLIIRGLIIRGVLAAKGFH